MDKIRSWPRWYQYGLTSAAAAFLLHIFGLYVDIPEIRFIGLGALAPWFLSALLTDAPSPLWEQYFITLVFWFLVGAQLGKSRLNFRVAVGIWVTIQIAMGFFMFIFINML